MQRKENFPKKMENHFPVADGRIKFAGGDQELRTSTLIQDHPIRGQSQVDFLGESEGSLPPPQDSFPDESNFTRRKKNHPIPLKYIDVSRTTHTNLDVMQELASTTIGTSMGQEICLILGQVSLSLLYWKKNLQKDIRGPGRD